MHGPGNLSCYNFKIRGTFLKIPKCAIMLFQIVLACVTVCMQSLPSGALECYSCSNSSSITDCNAVVNCPIDSACSSSYEIRTGTRFYTLGCRDVMTCPSIPTLSSGGSSTLIGRSTIASQNCSECCHSNNCNRQLCQDQDSKCADDQTYDCARFGAITNICDEASHIKPYCKRFCGFCNTVDGGWSHWSQWSLCDVTCGNGTQTKSRNCSDPPPENGGSDCVGEKLQHKPCLRDLCPVHGGWSRWSEWGSCSVTCDIGLRRRDRTCSNPYPARNGDHCYGDARDDALCSPGACTNGSWSSWEAWSVCSQSCDAGLKTRSRHCDNPVPSLTGEDCVGDPFESVICNNHVPCQGPVVFYAYHLSTESPGTNTNLRFTTVTTNVGNAYNSGNGYFTAPANGTYTFSVQLCVYNNKAGHVGLFINENRYQSFLVYGDADHSCRTLSVSSLLKQGDKVHAKSDSHTSKGLVFYNNYPYRINSFSGALVMRL